MHILRYHFDKNVQATETHIFYRAMGLIENLFPGHGDLKREACFDALREVASVFKTDFFALEVTTEPNGVVYGNLKITCVNGANIPLRDVGSKRERSETLGIFLISQISSKSGLTKKRTMSLFWWPRVSRF